MEIQGPPGERFKEFLQRANAAGQGEHPVSKRGHFRLALMHGTDHVEFREALVHPFPVHQQAGNDADHAPLCGQDGVHQNAHEADRRPAIDQLQLPGGQFSAERTGGCQICRAGTPVRLGEHTSVSYRTS